MTAAEAVALAQYWIAYFEEALVLIEHYKEPGSLEQLAKEIKNDLKDLGMDIVKDLADGQGTDQTRDKVKSYIENKINQKVIQILAEK